jgi:hypothetical protein
MLKTLKSPARLFAVLAAVTAAIFPVTAAAEKPIAFPFEFQNSFTLTDACSFPVTIHSHSVGIARIFLDENGVARVNVHIVEQDTLSANGKSLIGVPYTFNILESFDSEGNLTDRTWVGTSEKVPLPDGGLFIAAGLFDAAAHGFPQGFLIPDVGATANLDRFCAALAP